MPYFYRSGQRVDLDPLPGALSVRVPSVSPERLRALFEKGGIDVIALDERSGVVVVQTSPRSSRLRRGAGRDPLAHVLGSEGLDQRAQRGPAYRRAGGLPEDLWVPTGRLFIRLPITWTRAQVDALIQRHDLRVLEAIDEMPNGFLVQVEQGDPVEIACALIEKAGALDADPDFIRRLPRRAAAGRR